MQETQFRAADVSQERRVIHFTSGETLDLDSEDEKEEEEERLTFRDPERKARLSIKNLARRVGRLSLLMCDFLGERMASVLGLNDAKYQYAIDQHQRHNNKTMDREDPGTAPLSPEINKSRYGATEDTLLDEEHQNHSEGRPRCWGQLNVGYQAEDPALE